MKVEAWVIAVPAIFFTLVTPAYWWIAEDPTGTWALAMTAGLGIMITLYIAFHARRLAPRLEDRKDAEIEEGAGELGFFPPYSWWPLWCAACGAVVFYALALTEWWLVAMGFGFGMIAVMGLVFEYYRGEHAH